MKRIARGTYGANGKQMTNTREGEGGGRDEDNLLDRTGCV